MTLFFMYTYVYTAKDSALQIRSVRVWQNRDAAAASHKAGSTSPSISPAYDPSHSSSSSHKSSSGGSHKGTVIFGTLLFLLLAGGAIVYGLYLKMGGWPWAANANVPAYASVHQSSAEPASYQGKKKKLLLYLVSSREKHNDGLTRTDVSNFSLCLCLHM